MPSETACTRQTGCSGREPFKDIAGELYRAGQTAAESVVALQTFRSGLGLRPDTEVYFANHHFSHALSAFFFTPWENALLYTADGCGDNVHYSARHFDGRDVACFYGDDRWLLREREINSLGHLYGFCTQALGYRINRHEGKLTGLAAFGKPTLYDEIAAHFWVDSEAVVRSDFPDNAAMRAEIFRLADGVESADVAASIQKLLEDRIFESVTRYLERTKTRHLALAGGVFANVRLNRLLCEKAGVDEIFVFPAMGDEGLAVGNALEYLLARDGMATWSRERRRLDTVYWGRDYGTMIDTALAATPGVRRLPGRPAEAAAREIIAGRVGAIYHGRMEFGPRALGTRSILASPTDNEINTALNARLQRTEFMPFAPVTDMAHAAELFEITSSNAYACKFMTITCAVRPEWRERIPAVVHVDGTARPQIIDRRENPLYYDIIEAYRRDSGVPALINTSFNAHEEPIVNAPAEAVAALTGNRIDFLVTSQGVYAQAGSGSAP